MELYANVTAELNSERLDPPAAEERQGTHVLRKVKAFMLWKMFHEQYLAVGTGWMIHLATGRRQLLCLLPEGHGSLPGVQ